MAAILSRPQCDNPLKLEQKNWHFAADNLRCIFLNFLSYFNEILLKSVSKDLYVNIGSGNAWCHQAITWTNADQDPWHNMAP